MDVYGALQGRIGRLGVHDVENPVDRLIAARSQDRGTEDPLAFSVDEDFHETSRFTFLDRASDLRHRSKPDKQALACSLRLCFGQSDPAKGRIGKESVGGYPVTDPTSVLIEQVGRYDLKVIAAVWVNAPLPLQSPNAQMPGALVRNSSSTTM
jgi:hypothetical protein